jgi:hypothetical protein
MYYDYSLTVINGMNNKTSIICPIHGEFFQRPADHIHGSGCPICAKAKQGGYCERFFQNNPESKELPAKLYLISVDKKFCKIGITTKRYLRDRFSRLHFDINMSVDMSLYDAYICEQIILKKYKMYRFKIKDLKQMKWQTGWTECFPLSVLPQLKQELGLINDN